jgi:hypothetical protein
MFGSLWFHCADFLVWFLLKFRPLSHRLSAVLNEGTELTDGNQSEEQKRRAEDRGTTWAIAEKTRSEPIRNSGGSEYDCVTLRSGSENDYKNPEKLCAILRLLWFRQPPYWSVSDHFTFEHTSIRNKKQQTKWQNMNRSTNVSMKTMLQEKRSGQRVANSGDGISAGRWLTHWGSVERCPAESGFGRIGRHQWSATTRDKCTKNSKCCVLVGSVKSKELVGLCCDSLPRTISTGESGVVDCPSWEQVQRIQNIIDSELPWIFSMNSESPFEQLFNVPQSYSESPELLIRSDPVLSETVRTVIVPFTCLSHFSVQIHLHILPPLHSYDSGSLCWPKASLRTHKQKDHFTSAQPEAKHIVLCLCLLTFPPELSPNFSFLGSLAPSVRHDEEGVAIRRLPDQISSI